MGRYSDSEDERRKRKKKKKKRSRSRSVSSDDSKLSSRPKKSKKSKHKRKSRSQSRDEYRRSRSRSRGRRSRSYDRRSRSRSRGRKSRSPNYRRSRSLSRERFSRRRSRSRSYERRSSRSYSRRSRSRSRYSRSKSRERHRVKSRRRSRSDDRSRGNSSRYDSRSPSRVKVKEEKPADPCTTVPGFSEMTPSEQVQVRMQMALKAAAAADEKIKEQLNRGLAPSGSLEDQMKFNSAVNDIESSTFVQTSFTSNRTDKPTVEVKKDDFSFGTAAEFKPDMNPRKALNLDDFTDFSHPNLRVDPDVKMERWIQRLTVLRRRKLEGEVIT